MTLLYIDDDHEDLFIFSKTLENLDVSIVVTTFTDGREALHYLASCEVLPHYIFLDYWMPRFAGSEVLAQLKKDNRLNVIPVIIHSASKEEDLKDTNGAMGFVRKSSSLQELTTSIQAIIKTI